MTMLLCFAALLLTSVILYIVPHGRVAYWTDWHLWGLSKDQWGDLHINLGVLFVLAGLLHIYYNWKALLAYMKDKAKKLKICTASFNFALAAVLFVTIGTLQHIPPMSTILHFGEVLKERASAKYGEPPYGHAELSSLRLFARRTDMDLKMALQLLREASITVQGPEQTILQIAQANQTTPKALFEIMKKAIRTQQTAGLPDAPPPGFGRLSFTELCRQYQLDIGKIIQQLARQKINARPEMTMKETAAANNLDPHALYQILQQTAGPGH
jgi:hypothetical protein